MTRHDVRHTDGRIPPSNEPAPTKSGFHSLVLVLQFLLVVTVVVDNANRLYNHRSHLSLLPSLPNTTMAQGNLRLSKKSSKSKPAQKRKAKLAKGRKVYKAKGAKAAYHQTEASVSKDIAKKNERHIAAKAVASGVKFFLTEVAAKGKQEHQKQLQERNKKQDKATKLSDRVKDQLKKLGRGP